MRSKSFTTAGDVGGPFAASLDVKMSRRGNYIQLLQPVLARLGLWAMLLSWQCAVGHVSACSSLSLVLTCSIPMAASEMRGFCGHSTGSQSCAASAQAGAERERTSFLPAHRDAGESLPLLLIATIPFL